MKSEYHQIFTLIFSCNQKDFIAQARESALAQKGAFQQSILIADESSTDSDFLRRELEQMPDDAYVALLKGCDYWTDEHKLDKQVKFLEKEPDCSMVFSRVCVVENNRNVLVSQQSCWLPKVGPMMLASHDESCNPFYSFSSCLFKASLLKKLPPEAFEGPLREQVVAFALVKFGWLGHIAEPHCVCRPHKKPLPLVEELEQKVATYLVIRKVAFPEQQAYLIKYLRPYQSQLSTLKVNQGQGLAISIVTICRNNLEGLKKTAASVLAQKDGRHEWIIIDGGSTDGSAEYIKSELASHVSYWCSEPDKGVYDALNKGTLHAKGEYVIAMNSGDTFAEADTLTKVLSHPFNADVVYGDWLYGHTDRDELMRSPRELELFHFLRVNCHPICHQTIFIRTQVLLDSPYDLSYLIFADYAKLRTLMLAGFTFQHLDVTVCRFADGGLSSNKTVQSDLELCRIFSEAIQMGEPEARRALEMVDGLRLSTRLRAFRRSLVTVSKVLTPNGPRRALTLFGHRIVLG